MLDHYEFNEVSEICEVREWKIKKNRVRIRAARNWGFNNNKKLNIYVGCACVKHEHIFIIKIWGWFLFDLRYWGLEIAR